MLHDLRSIVLVSADHAIDVPIDATSVSDPWIVTCSSTHALPSGRVCQDARCEDPHGDFAALATFTATLLRFADRQGCGARR